MNNIPIHKSRPSRRAPYVPTPYGIVSAMLRLAEVRGSDVVYDLGCGDGRIVIAAARDHGARGVGIDSNPERIKECKEHALKAGVGHLVRFLQGDLFEAEVHEATVVTLYLLSRVNIALRPKLLREMRPGSRIVSFEFAMGLWQPDAMSTVDEYPVYCWHIPA